MTKKIQTGEQITNPTIGEVEQAKKTVVMEHSPDKFCIACGTEFRSEFALVLPKDISAMLEPALCKACQPAVGTVLLVSVHNNSPRLPSGRVDLTKLMRTGNSAELSNEMYTKIFEQPVPNGSVTIVGEQVTKKLNRLKEDLDFVSAAIRKDARPD